MTHRISSHKISTETKNNIRKIIDKHNCLFREITERDYGIDGIIECFTCEGGVTGKFALVQLKGTKNKIVPLKNKDVISCSISTVNAEYALQRRIPVILLYASLESEDIFYYVCLQDVEITRELLDNQKSVNVHIPIENIAIENIDEMILLVDRFY